MTTVRAGVEIRSIEYSGGVSQGSGLELSGVRSKDVDARIKSAQDDFKLVTYETKHRSAAAKIFSDSHALARE